MHRELRTQGGLAMHHMPAKTPASTAAVLLVHGYGQNKHAWHLPSRSVDRMLAKAGFDVFNLELRGHGASRRVPSAKSVEDYVALDLPDAVAKIRSLTSDPLFLVGHSLGGLVCYAAAAALGLALPIAGIVTLGSPFHFGEGSRALRAIAPLIGLSRKWLRTRDATVPLGIFQYPLLALRPFVERGGAIARATRPLLPVRPWHPGTLEPSILREHVSLAFDRVTVGETQHMFGWAQARSFTTEGFDYASRFRHWEGPVLIVGGTHDELAPPAGVRVAYSETQSRDRTYLEVPHGHIDMIVGKRAQETVWDPVIEWLRQRAV